MSKSVLTLTFKCQTSNYFDFQHSNVERLNDTNVKYQTLLTFDSQMWNVKMIRMSNVKLF